MRARSRRAYAWPTGRCRPHFRRPPESDRRPEHDFRVRPPFRSPHRASTSSTVTSTASSGHTTTTSSSQASARCDSSNQSFTISGIHPRFGFGPLDSEVPLNGSCVCLRPFTNTSLRPTVRGPRHAEAPNRSSSSFSSIPCRVGGWSEKTVRLCRREASCG